jgi:hypothetical protein
MDAYSIGNSRAAVNLADILTKTPKFQRRVMSKLHKFFRLYNVAAEIDDPSRDFFAEKVWQHCNASISQWRVEEKIKTHAKNVCAVRYKQIARGER